MSEQIDHKALAESRLATQFKESVNLINYIRTLLSEADTLEQVFQDLLNKRWIDTAERVNLDIIGAIVGQPRRLIDATFLSYFGFSPFPSAQSFGTVDDEGIGGRFRSVGELTTGIRTLTDEEYRLFIKAKIIKNSISPTVNATLEFFSFLFGIDGIFILDGNMHYTVSFGRPLTNNEKAIVLNTDLFPKPSAVGNNYQEHLSGEAFSFAGVPGEDGFGTLSDPLLGGTFATLI